MKKIKWLSILVLLLVAANIATLSLFWIKKNSKPKPPKRGGAIEFLIDELQLDSAQKQKFMKEKESFIRAKRQLDEKEKIAKDSLFELLKTNTTVQERDLKIKNIAILNEEINVLVFNHFAKLKSFCTQTQQEKFNKIIKEALKRKPPPRLPINEKPGEERNGPPEFDEERRPPPPPRE